MSLLPVLFPTNVPDVRPPRIPLKIETEDTEDIEIIGKTGKCIDLACSQGVRVTFQEKQAEEFRIFDVLRITNPLRVPPAALNTRKGQVPEGLRNYVDVECTHYMQYRNVFGHFIVEKFKKPAHSPPDGRFVIQENVKRSVRG